MTQQPMRRVVIESPYAGDVARNLRYAAACVADCLRRGEAPIASHIMYTYPGCLDDNDPAQRLVGMWAGFSWREVADATVVYEDLGISAGMQAGIDHARSHAWLRYGKDPVIEYRRLGGEWSSDG